MKIEMKHKKILILGNAASGKSWLSKRIAEKTGYPLYHLDVEFWKPDWVMTPVEEQIPIIQRILAQDSWIIDGNYATTLEIRYKEADLVIFLDISRLQCMWSAVFRQGKKRSDLPDYLEEKVLDKEFWEFLKWIWSFPMYERKELLEMQKRYPEKEFIHIRSRKEMKNLLMI